jgi:hypothetical protein
MPAAQVRSWAAIGNITWTLVFSSGGECDSSSVVSEKGEPRVTESSSDTGCAGSMVDESSRVVPCGSTGN